MLKEIRMVNFKCFEDRTIELKNLTVLTGLNGMGKSTVIQGILLLRQSYINSNFSRGLELSGEYTDLGNGKDVLYEKAIDDEKISFVLVDEIEQTYSFVYDSEAITLRNDNLNRENINDILKTNNFIYLASDRIIPQKRYELGNRDDVDNRSFGKKGEYALQYVSRHGADSDSIFSESNLSMEIEKWMNEISPGVIPDINVNPDSQFADLRFKFKESKYMTNPYKAINVGFGITYVLPVVVALLTADRGDYIVIENPEAHIHPRGQRKMGELISYASSRGAQVIIETHSDHVMNGIRLSVKEKVISQEDVEFAYFYRDEDTFEHLCVYPNINEEGRFDFWPDGFFDEWETSLMELL